MKKEANLEGMCKEIVLMMQSVMDGTAPKEEKQAVEEHISHCPSCQRTYEDLVRIRKKTAELAAEPPCDLKERILKRVNEEQRAEAIQRVRRSKSRRRGITSVLAAAAVITLCVFGAGRLMKDGDIALMGTATMDSAKFFSTMSADKAEDADAVAVEEAMEPPTMVGFSASGMEMEAGTTEHQVYSRESILEDAERILNDYAVKGMYAQVFYANVDTLPSMGQPLNSGAKTVGIYETEDFVDFVTSNAVAIRMQYEFTNGAEITSCGLEYGGSGVLVILVVQ